MRQIEIDISARTISVRGIVTYHEEQSVYTKSTVFFGLKLLQDSKNDIIQQKYRDLVENYSNLSKQHAMNKALTDVLDCTPSKLFVVFKQLQYKVFIEPLKRYTRYIPRKSGKIEPLWQRKIQTHKSMCEQLLNDGLEKLIPICVAIDKTPSECKQYFGKGVWKKICALSGTKIGLIAGILIEGFFDDSSLHNSFLKTITQTLIELKYNTLKQTKRHMSIPRQSYSMDTSVLIDFIRWYDKNIRTSKSVQEISTNMRYWGNIISDTAVFSREIDAPINFKWTPNEFLLKHDEYSAEITRRYRIAQDKKFKLEYPVYKKFQELLSQFNTEQYSVVAFRTPEEMYKEGEEQRHCIGSYMLDMHDGKESLLFKLQDKTHKTYSCIQLKRNPIKMVDAKRNIDHTYFEWNAVQHYKHHNMKVDCQEAIQTVIKIVNHLNKMDFVV